MIADGADRVEVWQADLEVLLERIGVWFGRRDLRGRMRDYIVGLLAPAGRKNGWQLAEYAGHKTPDGLQRLLRSVRWDADPVREDVCGFVAERLGEADGVVIVDDTGFVKKGRSSYRGSAAWSVSQSAWSLSAIASRILIVGCS